MRTKSGLRSYNIRFTPEIVQLLEEFQLSESNRLRRVVSKNSCILRAIKLAATAKPTESTAEAEAKSPFKIIVDGNVLE
jgi:hypothetical protein